MSFIEAGNNHPQENIYRPGFSHFIKRIVTGVGKKVERIHKSRLPKKEVSPKGSFRSFIPEKKQEEFKSGIIGGDNIPVESTGTQANKNLGPIHVKMVHENEIGPTLEIESLNISPGKIIKPTIVVPYQTMYYNTKGKGYQTIPKGTEITYESSHIYSLYDKKTGKYQSYAKVCGFTKLAQSGEKYFDSIPGGYIRTPWFDGVINKQEKNLEKPPEIQKKSISFSGYLGPDGREIPEYILKAVTVNYFGKKIVPRVIQNIQNTESKIEAVREIMKKEYTTKKIPLQFTSVYPIQIQQIAEKGKLEAVRKSLQEFTINNGNIYNPTTQKILYSLQRTPEWELIKQDASYVYKKKRIKVT